MRDVAARLVRPLEARRQREGVGHQLEQRRVLHHLLHDDLHARRRTARPASLHCAHPSANARSGLAEAAHRLLLQHQNAEIEGDGIEAGGEADARPAFLRRRVVFADHVVDPGRLAGEVAVVRAVFRAGLHQRLSVEREGADGRDDDFRSARHRVERRGFVRIGHDQPRVSGRADQRSHVFELRLIAPGHRPAGAAVLAAVLAHEVLRDEAPGVARRAVDHDVEFPVSHVQSLSFAARCAPPGAHLSKAERHRARAGVEHMEHHTGAKSGKVSLSVVRSVTMGARCHSCVNGCHLNRHERNSRFQSVAFEAAGRHPLRTCAPLRERPMYRRKLDALRSCGSFEHIFVQ